MSLCLHAQGSVLFSWETLVISPGWHSLVLLIPVFLAVGLPGLFPLLTCDPAILLQSLEVLCGSQNVTSVLCGFRCFCV